MLVDVGTLARPGRENEDHVVVTDTIAVVLDGAGMPAGASTGCIHGVPWYVSRLAEELVATASQPSTSLTSALGHAIAVVAADHGSTCDPHAPRSPSSTVVVVRKQPVGVDWLVLGDSTLVLDESGELRVVLDDRLSRIGRAQRKELRNSGPTVETTKWDALIAEERRLRNRDSGWWIAAGDPAAAEHAIVGTSNARRVLMLSDGAARPVVSFKLFAWQECLTAIATEGAAAWLAGLRAAERSDPLRQRWPRSKTYDDATAVLLHRESEPTSRFAAGEGGQSMRAMPAQ